MKKDSDKKPIKQLTIKTISRALDCIKQDIEFNLRLPDKTIMFVGGILSKLEGNKQFVVRDNKWVEVQWEHPQM